MNSNPRICASIISDNLTLVKMIEPEVDLLEIRQDLIGPDWRHLVKLITKPWIACNRRQEEGGKAIRDEARRTAELLEAGEVGASIIDIEYGTPNLIELIPAIKAKAQCLVSYHDYRATPALATLVGIVQGQRRAGADICKVVTQARCLQDNITILKLIRQSLPLEIIAFAMGDEGRISRILSPFAGGYLTYASAGNGLESAAGQIPLAELKEFYRYLA